jgi:hypothetical protein
MSEERQGYDRLGEFVAWDLEWQVTGHHEVGEERGNGGGRVGGKGEGRVRRRLRKTEARMEGN